MDQFLNIPWPFQLGVVIIVCVIGLGIFRFILNLFMLAFMILFLWSSWVVTYGTLYILSLFKRNK